MEVKQRQDAKQHLHDAIECLETEANYNEAIQRLHNCLELAPAYHPFQDIHYGAIIYLGLAHVRKNEFEQALNNLARLPPDIIVDIEYIPSHAIQIFLVMGFEAFGAKNYSKAQMIYHVVESVSVDNSLKVEAKIGAAITRYKKEKKSLPWLNTRIKGVYLPYYDYPFSPFQTWAERFIKFGKERKEDKASVEEFTIAKFLYEAHFPEEKKRLVKINKCLAKCYFKLNDSKETIIHLDACLKMEPNFYKNFWKSQKAKGNDERDMDPSKAMERFALLSLITIRMPQCDEWRQEIIDFHLQFSRLLIEEELYEKTVDSLDDLKEYLQFDTYHDEILAKELKQLGDILTRSKMHSLAKRVYSNAKEIVPPDNTSLKRDLISSCSYMNELLGNYEGALSDAKKLEKFCHKWSETHLRIGRAHLGMKDYRSAFAAFCNCYTLSTSADQANVLELLLVTKLSAGNEKQQNSMVLPKGIATEVINDCLESLASDGSEISMKSIKYLLCDEEYNSKIKADGICLASLMQNNAPSEVVLSLIDKGANLTGSPSALHVFIEDPNQSSEVLLRLLEKGVDVSDYIDVITGEPWQHKLVRLCVKQDNLDALSSVAKNVDFRLTDERANNLLHVLAKIECDGDSSTVFNCMKLVTKRAVINPNLENDDGKKPVDYLESKEDERYTFLEELAKTGGIVQGSKKKKKKKKEREINVDLVDTIVENEEALDVIASAVEKQTESKDDSKTQGNGKPATRGKQDTAERILYLIQAFEQVDPNEKPEVAIDEGEYNPTLEEHAEESLERNSVVVEDLPNEDSLGSEEEAYTCESFQAVTEEFEDLPWEVHCTPEFLKKLRDPKLNPNIKGIVLKKVTLLASGDWRPKLAKQIEGPKGIRLYKGRLTQSARLIWEEAIAFSDRRSADESINRSDNCGIYIDVIRLWDFTLRHDEVPRMIDRISRACTRGQSSTVTKNLKVQNNGKTEDGKRLPRLYYHEYQSVTQLQNSASHQAEMSNNTLFFPPASPNDREFHILKFYALSNAMAKCLLQTKGHNFDFPFQVSELEHRIIRLTTEPAASILLLGRSGTGKTTCCLYRLWNKFKAYWENAVTAGAHIPVLQRLIEIDSSEDESQEDQASAIAEDEEEGSTCLTNGNRAERSDVMSCGCRKVCMCTVAAVRANYAGVSDVIEEETGNEKEVQSSIINEGGEQSVRSDENDNRYRHLRQLFITKNKVLCHEVRKNFRDLCNGLSVAEDHVQHFSEETVVNLNEIVDLSYPLFLGSRDLLLALDATLPGKPFFARLPNGKLLAPIAGWGEKESHLSFLPGSDSEDEEEDEDDTVDKKEMEGTTRMKNEKVKRKTNTVKREITYTVFVHEVWPLLEKKSSIGYHPSLVWTEFCSFIKGTVESLQSDNGYMSQEEYHSIGGKKAPTFTGDRDVIYDMFKRYRKICTTKNLFNEFDLLHNIYKRLCDYPLQPWLFDEIYVDETQDFTEAELFLLIRCCQNPNQLFFTGDTAQNIMRGVTFRFCDLRSLFFNAKKALGGSKKSPIEVPDTVHQLKYNYRSHKGILKLASSIVHLLGSFFPESFDRLEDDVGLFDGPKPVILETSDFAELAMVLRGARRKTSSPIEFGAHQVVLVASEKSKEDLPEELSYALVLTIYESKGLEFDDVLLYNFFKDSQAHKEWRAINSYLDTPACKGAMAGIANEENDSVIISKGENELSFESHPLKFNYNKHKILNSELKQLYTALTRARVNVWIYDEDRESRAPMFNYFNKLGLVEILKLDENAYQGKGMFAEESSTADWEQQGQYFYKKELWNVAYKCFAKTRNETMLKRCEGHLYAMKAYKMAMEWQKRKERGSLKSVHQEYLTATECYLKCGMGDEAVICLKNAKKWKLLGELLFKMRKFREAGRYFARAATSNNDMKEEYAMKSCESYKKCGDYRSAVDVLFKNKKYRECIIVMKEYEEERKAPRRRLQQPRSTISIERIVKEAADACIKRSEMSLLKKYLSELPFDKQLDYVKKKPGCEEIALEILIEYGRAEEAAEIYMRKGKFLKAASCSKVDAFKGVCFLEQARLIYSKAADKDGDISEEVKESILHYLNQSLLYLENDLADLADCRLMIGVITDSLQDLKYAADIYSKCENYVGALLCQKHLWEKGEIASDVIVESLSKMLLLIERKSLNKMKMLQVYFGIETVVLNDSDLHFRVNDAKLRLHFRWMLSQESQHKDLRKHFENQNQKEGNLCIISATFSLANEIVDKLMDLYERELQRNTICLQSLQGVAHENCQLQHGSPSFNTIQRRCNAYFAILQIHGLLRERMAAILKHDKLREHVKEFKSLTRFNEKSMVEKCHSFYMDLMCFTQYLSKDQCSGMHLAKSLPKMHFVKDQIMWCIGKMWKDAGEEGKFSDMNLFLEVFTMSSYAGVRFVQYEVDNIRKEIKQRYIAQKSPPKWEIALFNKRESIYESFHTMFMDSREWMHDEGDLIEFLHVLLRRSFALVLRKDVALPSVTNSLMLLELCLSLCLISLCRTNQNAEIYIPEYYIEGVEFWSSSYGSCFNSKYTAFDSIQYVSSSKGSSLAESLALFILKLVSHQQFKRFDLFRQAFDDTELLQRDPEYRANAERFLILVLVLLSNHRLFSDDPSSTKPIITQLRKYARKERQAPGFILGALNSASRINNLEDPIKVVDMMLQQSKRALLRLNWKAVCRGYIPEIAEEEKPKAEVNLQSEEKIPNVDPNIPTVTQSPQDDIIVSEEGDGLNSKHNSTANNQNEGRNYFQQISKDNDFKTEDQDTKGEESLGSMAGKKVDIFRGISYEEEIFDDLGDSEPTRKANEKRQLETQVAACKIQLWWRIVNAIRAQKRREHEELTNESKVEEHVQKYASDLSCIPCGKRCESREDLHKHILQNENHDNSVNNYRKYIQYKESTVDSWLKQADDVLDRKVLRQTEDEQQMTEKLHKAIGVVYFSLNTVKMTCAWTDLNALKNSIKELQKAYYELNDQIAKVDDHHAEEMIDNDNEKEDDFELVNKRKGKKFHKKVGKRY